MKYDEIEQAMGTTAGAPLVVRHIEAFREGLMAGIGGIVRCGEILVEALAQDPRNLDVFKQEFKDWITDANWAMFEDVGRHKVNPKLLLGAGGKHRARIRRLTKDMQDRIFEGERFPLIIEQKDEKHPYTTLQVDVRELNSDQANQMFDGPALRSEAKQRIWIAAYNKASAREEVQVMPYVIKGGCVIFAARTQMTRQELKRLLQEM